MYQNFTPFVAERTEVDSFFPLIREGTFLRAQKVYIVISKILP